MPAVSADSVVAAASSCALTAVHGLILFDLTAARAIRSVDSTNVLAAAHSPKPVVSAYPITYSTAGLAYVPVISSAQRTFSPRVDVAQYPAVTLPSLRKGLSSRHSLSLF